MPYDYFVNDGIVVETQRKVDAKKPGLVVSSTPAPLNVLRSWSVPCQIVLSATSDEAQTVSVDPVEVQKWNWSRSKSVKYTVLSWELWKYIRC